MCEPLPTYYGEDDPVPWCNERCPLHDGKRCEALGHRPSEVCLPVTRELLNRRAPTNREQVNRE